MARMDAALAAQSSARSTSRSAIAFVNADMDVYPRYTALQLFRVLIAGLAALAIGACERHPTSASPGTPARAVNIAGVWQGQYVETGCSVAGCTTCCQPSSREARFRLTITQQGEAVAGQWAEDRDQTGGYYLVGTSITGSVAGRTVALFGSLSMNLPVTPFPNVPPWALSFRGQVAEGDAKITGDFSRTQYDAAGREVESRQQRLISLERVP